MRRTCLMLLCLQCAAFVVQHPTLKLHTSQRLPIVILSYQIATWGTRSRYVDNTHNCYTLATNPPSESQVSGDPRKPADAIKYKRNPHAVDEQPPDVMLLLALVCGMFALLLKVCWHTAHYPALTLNSTIGQSSCMGCIDVLPVVLCQHEHHRHRRQTAHELCNVRGTHHVLMFSYYLTHSFAIFGLVASYLGQPLQAANNASAPAPPST